MTQPIELNINNTSFDTVEINLSPTQQNKIELIKTPVNIKGESAYEIALRNGFIGSELDWLNSLKTSTLNWNSNNW